MDVLNASESSDDYWRRPADGTGSLERSSALWEEQRTQLTELLGPEARDDPLRLAYEKRRYGNLSTEKLIRLLDVQKDYAQLRAKARPAGQPFTPEMAVSLIAIEREFRTDLGRLLTPAELEQYDLRSSPAAGRLRMKLGVFETSESEFQKLFSLYRQIDEQYPILYASGGPQDPTGRARAEADAQSKVEAILSPERFADFIQASNPDHSQLNTLVTRLQLPISAAREVVAIQQDISARATVAASPGAAREHQQSIASRAEAQRRITAILGASGFDAYERYCGAWLAALGPATP